MEKFQSFINLPITRECELHITFYLMSHITKVLMCKNEEIVVQRYRNLWLCSAQRHKKCYFHRKNITGKMKQIFSYSLMFFSTSAFLRQHCFCLFMRFVMCFIDYSKSFDNLRYAKRFILDKKNSFMCIKNNFYDTIKGI